MEQPSRYNVTRLFILAVLHLYSHEEGGIGLPLFLPIRSASRLFGERPYMHLCTIKHVKVAVVPFEREEQICTRE